MLKKLIIMLALLSTISFAVADDRFPRGVRNNNPGNIEQGNTWLGEARTCGDKRFECFESKAYGARALIKTLYTYYYKHDLWTIREMITRFAPPEENDTDAYVRYVSRYVLKHPDDFFESKLEILNVAIAIGAYENGGPQWFPLSVWVEAMEMLGERIAVN